MRARTGSSTGIRGITGTTLAAFALALAGCGGGGATSTAATSGAGSGSATHGATTSTSTASSGGTASTASSGTSGHTTGSAGSLSSSTAATGSTSSGSTSGAGSTTGGLVGPVYTPCDGGFAYFGGNCLAASCTSLPYRTPCALSDGGVGACAGATCQTLNLETDDNNCGTFGVVCPTNDHCNFGECETAAFGLVACASAQCPTGRVCVQDVGCLYPSTCLAAPDDSACEGATGEGLCCGGQCVSTATSASNCGGCGVACPSGASCVGSQCLALTCALDAGFGTTCSLVGGGSGECCNGVCTDTANDLSDCGGCGATCPPGAFGCFSGYCETGCAQAGDCTSGTCVGGNCLPTACGPGAHQQSCALSESSGLALKGGCCGTTCVNLQGDPNNCGQCGVSCNGGACISGRCVGYPPLSDCTQAANGQTCLSAGRQGTCCGGACTFDDTSNCGACGYGCPSGDTCTNPGYGAQCGLVCSTNACPAGQVCDTNGEWCLTTTCTLEDEDEICSSAGTEGVCCGGTCAHTTTDARNCGACGRVCPTGQTCASGFCSGASCTVSGCPAGAVCDTQLGCVPTGCADAGNGRQCGFGLPLGSGALKLGVCCGGSCVDSTEDPQNCGGCGLDCADGGTCLAADGVATCLGAAPVAACLQSCAPGTYCSGSTCLLLTCESAGQVCPAADGPPGLCCAVPGGFTCADLFHDPQNCGGCAVRCPAGQTCAGGVCSGTPAPCDAPGRIGAFCNLAVDATSICCPGIGCVDTATDSSNCGACGRGCPLGTSCTAGACM